MTLTEEQSRSSLPVGGRLGVWGLIKLDLLAKSTWMYGKDDWRSLVKTLATDGTAAMLLYRIMQWAHRRRIPLLAMACNKLNAVVCQCIIGRRADFGPAFVLIHSQGVVINSAVRGGSRVFVEHQVTIGAERGRIPTIGNDVFFGAGCKVIGAVNIGDGARVGANAVVVHDVPPHSTVVGIPAKVVSRREGNHERVGAGNLAESSDAEPCSDDERSGHEH